MALSITVNKKSVTNTQERLYSITLELILTDTAGEGLIKDYSTEYRTGESVSVIKQNLISQMQNDIDSYKSAQTLSNNVALATAITDIKNSLVL